MMTKTLFSKNLHKMFMSLGLASASFSGSVEAEICCFCNQDHAANIPCPNAGFHGQNVLLLTSFIHLFDGLPMDTKMQNLFDKLNAANYDPMAVLQALNIVFNGRERDYSMTGSPRFAVNGVEYNRIWDAINRMALEENYRNGLLVHIYKDAYDAFVRALEKYVVDGHSEGNRNALFDSLVFHIIIPSVDLIGENYEGNYYILCLVRLLACLPERIRNQLVNAMVNSDPASAKGIALDSPNGVYTRGPIELLSIYFQETHDQGGKMIEKLRNIKDELKHGEISFVKTGEAISSILDEHGYWERFSINGIGELKRR